MSSRRKQFLVGLAIIAAFSLSLLAFRAAGYLPGFAGEFFRTALGFVSTPFFMEAAFATFGLALLIALNSVRNHLDGDEFVELDEVSAEERPDLPERARLVMHRDEPLVPLSDALLATAEGAYELGDYDTALEILAELSPVERNTPDALALRLWLARATGRTESVAKLSARLAATAPGHPALDSAAD